MTGPEICPVTGLVIYQSRDVARAALRGLRRHRRKPSRYPGGQLHVFPCRGHWHHGRMIRRARVAWRAVP